MRYVMRIALCATAVIAPLAALDPPPAAAHSVSVFVTPSAQEALTWCGPATAQMAMTGYPGGTGCTRTQAALWLAIQGHKVESFWDTDPVGLEKTLEDCGGSWTVTNDAVKETVMYWVARWMTQFHYPVAALLDTAPYSEFPAHEEHWVLIIGVQTDVDPTTTTTVNLQGVWVIDPEVPLGVPPTPSVQFFTAAQWYAAFQAVTKASSAYHGKYVAVIEPPEVTGQAVAPGPLVLTGRVIAVEEALAAARRHIEEYRLADSGRFEALREARPLTPLLVNQEQGGYYLIPYSTDGETAGVGLLVNAYTGDLLQAGTFERTRFLSAQEAGELARRHLGGQAGGPVVAEAVFLREAGAGRYRPTWKVRVGDRRVGVTQSGEVVPRITDELYSLRIPAQRLAGIGGGGGRLWATDAGGRALLELQPATGGVLRRLDLDLRQPKGLAFDGELLWVADEATKRIHAFDPEQGARVRDIPLEVPAEKGFGSVEALAWDGRYLWTAIAAGFSSSLNQIDRESGRIVRSLFADCDPRGVASDGESLWALCFNGEANPPTVDQRRLAGDDPAVSRSRRFFKKAEGRQPSGLTWDGQFLWYLDAAQNRAVRFTAPSEH